MDLDGKLDKNNIENFMALTSLQQGILFHYISDEQSNMYHEQLSLIVRGEIKLDVFKKALEFVIENNEMLRTIFRWKGIKNPVQVVLKKHKVPIEYIDFTNAVDKNSSIENIKLKDLENRIDITKETLRVYLCKLDAYKYEMIISNHHILYDGWSNGIILKEFMEAYSCIYKGEYPKKTNKSKFSEFIKYINKLNKDKEKSFWSNYLRDLDNKDDYFSCRESGSYKEISYKIDENKANKIMDFAKVNKILLSAILYGAWGVLLQKFNNSKEAVFGITVSGRTENIKYIDNMVGLFINTIPLRVKSEKHNTFIDLIYDLDRTLNERKDFENTSLVDIKEYCGLKFNEEMFNSIVTIENYPLDLNSNEKDILTIENFSITEKTNYNMSLEILTFNGIEFKFNFNNSAIDESIAEKLGGYLEKIIDILISSPNISIEEFDILPKKERSQILYEFNDTKVEYLKDKTIYELFESQVEKTPDSIAVVFENKKLTYKELNERANSVAAVLRNNGVKTDSIVAIMIERSLDMIVGMMAILKAGGAYLPIDPEYPSDRVKYMLEDSKVNILLTQEKLTLSLKFGGHVINLDDNSVYIGERNNLSKVNNSKDLAYIIYTSGSTGNPKGVMIEHKSIVNTLLWRKKYYEFNEKDAVLQIPSFSFDSSVEDIFTPLISGAKLVLLRQRDKLDIQHWIRCIKKNNVTHFLIVPVLYKEFIELAGNDLNSLRIITVAGEKFSENLVKDHYNKMQDVKLINEYGPTENSVITTVYEFPQNTSSIFIGKPISNSKVYILDKYNKLSPIGVPGEICISGVGLARGYLNRLQLTEERFIDNPFEAGEKLYKTGDLGMWSLDGNIKFLGRLDHQVKIRGFRIELGEIEAVLLKHKYIEEAVVIARENELGKKYLCAYFVSDKELKTYELKEYLLKQLPEYMIPYNFFKLDKMPLTPNKKIDRNNLPQIEMNRDSLKHEYVKPKTENEKIIAQVWRDVLNVEEIGVKDNFFDLGGNSLDIIKVSSRINTAFNRDIPVVTLFRYPTISSIVDYLNQEGDKENSTDKLIDRSVQISNRKERLKKRSEIGKKINMKKR